MAAPNNLLPIYDRQHFGKPNGPDPGAQVDLDDDGLIEEHEQEANLTPLYYGPARRIGERMGHNSVVLDNGWYSARWKKANSIARANPHLWVPYNACHVNAGAGDYAVFIYDADSPGGKALAECYQRVFQAADLPGIRRVLVREATATNAWKRGYNTIRGIAAGPGNISGVCVEPYFLDREEHQWLATAEGGREIARLLVSGQVLWAAERGK